MLAVARHFVKVLRRSNGPPPGVAAGPFFEKGGFFRVGQHRQDGGQTLVEYVRKEKSICNIQIVAAVIDAVEPSGREVQHVAGLDFVLEQCSGVFQLGFVPSKRVDDGSFCLSNGATESLKASGAGHDKLGTVTNDGKGGEGIVIVKMKHALRLATRQENGIEQIDVRQVPNPLALRLLQ